MYLLPSLVRSLDCGFRYEYVLGFDKGDPFYDSKEVTSLLVIEFVSSKFCATVDRCHVIRHLDTLKHTVLNHATLHCTALHCGVP